MRTDYFSRGKAVGPSRSTVPGSGLSGHAQRDAMARKLATLALRRTNQPGKFPRSGRASSRDAMARASTRYTHRYTPYDWCTGLYCCSLAVWPWLGWLVVFTVPLFIVLGDARPSLLSPCDTPCVERGTPSYCVCCCLVRAGSRRLRDTHTHLRPPAAFRFIP